jgi:hypothetical protein
MYNSNIPTDRELPSTAKLVKSTILAGAAALVLLVTVVMPAEYGIDPTGIGNTLGLKKMGEIKMSLAQEAEAERQATTLATAETPAASPAVAARVQAEAAPEPAPAPAVEDSAPARTDEMSVTLAPNEGTEIKVALEKGKTVNYSWSTDGGKANFDVHGDSKELNIDYHNYSKGSEVNKEGVIEAAFNGYHGWFWRNRTSETLIVTLKTNGEYTEIKKVK